VPADFHSSCALSLHIAHNHNGAATSPAAVELDIKSMDTIKSLMANPALGLSTSLPVFNTEAGILQDAFAALGNNHTFGAGFLARTFVLNFVLGVRHCCWYAYDAGEVGC
jgi:hypothetical protein